MVRKLIILMNCCLWMLILTELFGKSIEHKEMYSLINVQLIPYVEQVIQLSNGVITQENLKNTTFKFSSLEWSNHKAKGASVRVGYCEKRKNRKEIVIDFNFWKSKKEDEKIFLMLHEILHCSCNRNHVIKLLSDGCPISVMHPQITTDNCIKKHHTRYINEAFQECTYE